MRIVDKVDKITDCSLYQRIKISGDSDNGECMTRIWKFFSLKRIN